MPTWIAIAVIAGQGALVFAVFHLVRSFGAYTSAVTRAVLKAQDENIAIQRTNFNLSDDLARLRAQMLEERAHRRHQPPQSEEVVA
jgi:hypothetical protein